MFPKMLNYKEIKNYKHKLLLKQDNLSGGKGIIIFKNGLDAYIF